MIYLFIKTTFYIRYIFSIYLFRKGMPKASRLSNRSAFKVVRLDIPFVNSWAIAKKRLSKVINRSLLANILCHLRFFLIWLPFSLLSQYKKEKSNRRKLYIQSKVGEQL